MRIPLRQFVFSDPRRYFPFLSWWQKVNKETIKADMIAGFTGAVIVLPQGVAFALIAGLPPEYGLYTAMITPIIAALFGSSLHLISGPTTAISIVVFSAISQYAEPGSSQFISMALTITFLAGLYQLMLGLARMGSLVNFVSHTVVIGFTAGAAILIATSQMKNILGINVSRGESFLHTWMQTFSQLPHINYVILFIAVVTMVTAVVVKKYYPKSPNLLIALIIGAILASLLATPSAGIKFVAAIPGHLPPLSMPDFSFSTIRVLAPDAFAVALLGLIEAVSISKSISTKSRQRIDPNQEFIGQGLSNIFGSFFSSYAGSGSFTRSGINYEAGAQTPMSAIFAAFFLMLLVLLVAPYSAYIPVAAMGGVIMLVAWKLIDFHQIKHILESSRTETAVLLVTFLSTLFLELEFAIYMGVFLSLVIFLARTSTPEIATLAPDYDQRLKRRALVDVDNKPLKECPQLKIIRIDMSIYFGSVDYVQKKLHDITEQYGVYDILIICEGVNMIDLTGAEMLQQEAERLSEAGGGLYFVGLKPQVYYSLSRAHLINAIGNSHFFDHKYGAIHRLQRLFELQGRCKNCKVRVFAECRATEKTEIEEMKQKALEKTKAEEKASKEKRSRKKRKSTTKA